MKTINQLILLLIFLILALGCSEDSPQVNRRVLDQDIKTTGPSNEQISTLSESQYLRKAQLEALLQEVEPIVKVQGQLDPEERDPLVLVQVLRKMQAITLDPQILLDPELRTLESDSGEVLLSKIVRTFNKAVIYASDSEVKYITRSSLIEDYKNLILWDCNQDLKGSCELVKYFRATDGTAVTAIMRLAYQKENDDQEKFRIVRAAFDLKNRSLDNSLRFMLLDRLRVSFNQVEKGQVSKERLQQDAYLFANTLKLTELGSQGASLQKKYAELIRKVNPLSLSRNRDKAANPALTDLIKIAGPSLIYTDQNKLTTQMQETIQEIGDVVGPQYEQGINFQWDNISGNFANFEVDYISRNPQMERLKQSIKENKDLVLYGKESSGILDNMLSDTNFKKDEYQYLVHQLFYSHFNIDDAATFWSLTHKNQERLMEAMENLVKLSIVNNIVYTNNRMNNFYNNNRQTKLIELLRESEKEASKIRKAWSKLIIRAKVLKSFAKRAVVEDSESKRQKLEKVSKTIDALKKNIKYLVTYPNMFPLMHVMASLNMKDKIKFFFFEWTIDSQLIIDQFFKGQLAPMFNFGNDGNPLDSTEIVYSYYYALATGIFNTYSTNKVVKFSDEEFFKVVVKRLIQSAENSMQDSIDSLQELRRNYSNAVFSIKKSCNEERELQKLEEERIAYLMLSSPQGQSVDWVNELQRQLHERSHANSELEFIELDKSVYEHTRMDEHHSGKYLQKLFSTEYAGVFDTIRTMSFNDSSTKTIQIARVLLDVYKNYSQQGSDGSIQKIFDDQFKAFNRLKSEYAQLYFEYYQEVSDCDYLFAKRDRDIRQVLIFKEAQYWGQMFDELDQLLASLEAEQRANLDFEQIQALEALRKKYMKDSQNPSFPSEYVQSYGFTAIDSKKITTYKMDIFARLMASLYELFPNQYNVTLPAVMENEYIYQKADPSIIYFDFTESDRGKAKKKFVQAGLSAFAEKLDWVSQFTPIDTMENKGNLLVSLFKSDTIALDPNVDCADSQVSEESTINNCKKISAGQVIEHFKNLIDFINIDERDEVALGLLNLDSKYNAYTYERFVKKENQHELYSLLDLTFKRVMTDGAVGDPISVWFKPTLEGYVDSVHKRKGSTFIFPYPEYIEKSFEAAYSEWLSTYTLKNLEFIQEVKKQAEWVRPYRFRYRLNKEYQIASSTGQRLDPLVSDLMLGKFSGYLQSLDYDTSRYFEKAISTNKQLIEDTLD